MIEFVNVSKVYGTGVRALQDINLSIDDGEFVFIVGRSGSGKSTLLKLLLKELDVSSGKIIVNGMHLQTMPRRHVPRYRRTLGIVFQDFRLLKDRNVYENIAFAQRVIGASGREMRERVEAMLRMLGLSAKYKSFPDQLSGGEQQRVAIGRALVNRPEILLADEPTGNLDAYHAEEILNLLLEINRQGTTVVVITHDRAMVERVKKRVLTLSRGRLISDENMETGEKKEFAPPEDAALRFCAWRPGQRRAGGQESTGTEVRGRELTRPGIAGAQTAVQAGDETPDKAEQSIAEPNAVIPEMPELNTESQADGRSDALNQAAQAGEVRMSREVEAQTVQQGEVQTVQQADTQTVRQAEARAVQRTGAQRARQTDAFNETVQEAEPDTFQEHAVANTAARTSAVLAHAQQGTVPARLRSGGKSRSRYAARGREKR